jgi:hypothetical protein
MEHNRVVEFNGKMYVLVRTIKEEQVNGNLEGLKAWKEQLHCDHVLKTNGHYLMVRFVEDIEWEEV